MSEREIFDSAALDELESHLWEEIDRGIDSEMDARRAFLAASARIGHADILANEYRKVSLWSRADRPDWIIRDAFWGVIAQRQSFLPFREK